MLIYDVCICMCYSSHILQHYVYVIYSIVYMLDIQVYNIYNRYMHTVYYKHNLYKYMYTLYAYNVYIHIYIYIYVTLYKYK